MGLYWCRDRDESPGGPARRLYCRVSSRNSDDSFLYIRTGRIGLSVIHGFQYSLQYDSHRVMTLREQQI